MTSNQSQSRRVGMTNADRVMTILCKDILQPRWHHAQWLTYPIDPEITHRIEKNVRKWSGWARFPMARIVVSEEKPLKDKNEWKWKKKSLQAPVAPRTPISATLAVHSFIQSRDLCDTDNSPNCDQPLRWRRSLCWTIRNDITATIRVGNDGWQRASMWGPKNELRSRDEHHADQAENLFLGLVSELPKIKNKKTTLTSSQCFPGLERFFEDDGPCDGRTQRRQKRQDGRVRKGEVLERVVNTKEADKPFKWRGPVRTTISLLYFSRR